MFLAIILPGKYNKAEGGRMRIYKIDRCLHKLFCCLFFLLCFPHAGAAEVRYIGDTLIVSLREEPSSTSKAIKGLRTGAALHIQEKQKGFYRVLTSSNLEGWVPAQYTTAERPKSEIIKELKKQIDYFTSEKEIYTQENKQLKLKIANLENKLKNSENELNQVSQAKQDETSKISRELELITNKYNELAENTKDAVKALQERDRYKKENTDLQNQVTSLNSLKKSLVDRNRLYWFLAGGGVFLIGWIIGKISHTKKRKSLTL